MHDMLTALLLVRHFDGNEDWRRHPRRPIPETEKPWARVFAWYRRRNPE